MKIDLTHLFKNYKLQAKYIYNLMKKNKININGKVFKNGKIK